MYFRGLCAATLLAACTTNTSQIAESRSELTFIIPEAVRPIEPKADRVLVLLGSGRVLTYDDAIMRRSGEAAASEAAVIGDEHGSAAYKRELLRVYVARAVRAALAGDAVMQ